MEEAKLKDLKVKNFLFQSIDRTILETILDKATSKGIWESMKQKYQGSTRVKRSQLQALRREFELLSMKDGEKVDSYVGRTLSVVNKMKANGEKVEQTTVVSKILRSLTPKYTYVVWSIEEANDLDTLSIDELHGSLLVHEQRMQGVQEEEQVLKVGTDEGSNRGRGRNSYRGRGKGRGRQSLNKSTVECYKCHKLGHFQYECPEWTNYTEVDEGEELLLMAYAEPQKSDKGELWFLDSGCSNHMTGNKLWFCEISEDDLTKTVKLGNNAKMAVTAKGSIRMQLNGTTQVIFNVYYVPELKSNLLSVGQLQEKGLSVLFQDGGCKVFHKQKGLIMETYMSHNMMFCLLASMMSNSIT